ncbi:Rad52/Rad22 family DNA repair protein [Vulcanococcus limneticus]|uniref:RAD52 family DNA repair protein n=1 Tax=Vulcanococcus limneticus TaxID=2170428 RepID=UPI00398BD054
MTTTLTPARSSSSRNAPTALQLIRQAVAAETDATPAASGTTPAAKPATTTTPPVLPSNPTNQANPATPAVFSAAQIAALSAPLDRALVSSREQGRSKVNYLQSWVVISEANRIFGFDGWQRQTLFSRCIAQAERLIGARGTGREQKSGWGVTYIARVRITVSAGCHGLLIREGTGAGHGIDTDLGLAHESAIKEAETDAMKRALMTFGNPFGLALYDKSQRQVSGGNPAGRETASGSHNLGQGNGQQPIQRNGQAPGDSQPNHRPDTYAAPSRRTSAQANPIAAAFNGPPRNQGQGTNGTRHSTTPAAIARPQPVPNGAPTRTKTNSPANGAALDPATIAALQERIQALLPPQLAAFSRAFRTAFQVPESTPSIAGLITEQRHLAWIQHYLAQGQAHS